jgi:hypothetical protein
MNVRKLRVLVPIVLVLFAVSAREAAAQAPTVTTSTSGPLVTVQWTAVPGATGYQINVTGSLSGTVVVPASTTLFTVTPPPGTYNVTIFATAGNQVGPASNTVSVTVGGGGGSPTPCAPPAATTVTASAQGMVVSVSWTPVAGTVGYRVEFSRTPGGTELVQTVGPNQTSVQGVAPFAGTFYVRVVSGNTCGTTPSAEVSFTAGTTSPGTPAPTPPTGSGPRTPDPVRGAPGVDCTSSFVEGDCMLPVPSYAAGVVASLAAQYPQEAAVARPSECRGGDNRFLFRVLRELRTRDTRWGLNYKRGNFPTLSEDIITYNATARPDEGESHVILFDIVGGSCFAGAGSLNGSVPQTYNGTWNQRGQSYCGTTYCARWTLAPYIAAGFTP